MQLIENVYYYSKKFRSIVENECFGKISHSPVNVPKSVDICEKFQEVSEKSREILPVRTFIYIKKHFSYTAFLPILYHFEYSGI